MDSKIRSFFLNIICDLTAVLGGIMFAKMLIG
jgi:hypothetical protein